MSCQHCGFPGAASRHLIVRLAPSCGPTSGGERPPAFGPLTWELVAPPTPVSPTARPPSTPPSHPANACRRCWDRATESTICEALARVAVLPIRWPSEAGSGAAPGPAGVLSGPGITALLRRPGHLHRLLVEVDRVDRRVVTPLDDGRTPDRRLLVVVSNDLVVAVAPGPGFGPDAHRWRHHTELSAVVASLEAFNRLQADPRPLGAFAVELRTNPIGGPRIVFPPSSSGGPETPVA